MNNAGTSTGMTKIAAGLFISLGGVVEAPAEWGFQFMTAEINKEIMEGIAGADAVLIGRKTYEEFLKLWPRRGSNVPMADFLNHTMKYVVSSKPDELSWQPAQIINGNFVEEIDKLKRQPGKNIQVPGSPTLVRSLLKEGLLDMLSLSICPIIVGEGQRLFDNIGRNIGLQVVRSSLLSNGVIGATYRPVYHAEQTASRVINFPDAAAAQR